MSANFDRMTAEQRLVAVNIDLSRNVDFAQLAGVACVGSVYVVDTMPTAATNGQHEWYGRDFTMQQNRKQLRYVKIHETLHKALHHCSEYMDVSKRYPRASNIAMDYVVNGMIEKIDPTFSFVERPTVPVLVDPKYSDWSFVQVLRELLKNAKPKPESGEGGDCDEGQYVDSDGNPIDGSHDEHKMGELTPEQAKTVEREITDALNQGKIMQGKLRGTGSSGSVLDNTLIKRNTNWRQHISEFFFSICEGDDYSRFSPPNKRFLPLGHLMPSHFSETTGEIIVACDTSGSMHGLYPVVFGEIARICENVLPEAVRIVWWEDAVVGEQVFTPKDFSMLAKLLKPKGGGGTRLSCVAEYITGEEVQTQSRTHTD
jgi:predicted metal-dependent peptidase